MYILYKQGTDMKMYDIINKKKNKKALTKEEIAFFIEGYTKNEIPDYQASALLMAICLNGMNKAETTFLTQEMSKSGEVLDLSEIKGIKVDKHSTGGVGDKTTLVLAPLVASCGVPVAKMSGRGLGHTGGTIDKLESIPGFRTSISNSEFIKNVNDIKLAIAAQTKNLAPADKLLYALRDVTATVDNISLIASSIMSKKLSSGADAIVLDVKVGNGAFMKTIKEATNLAKAMVEIGNLSQKQTIAVVTDMNQPLGNAIGNTLEVIEAIETLNGNGPKDFLELVICLGVNMLILGKITDDEKKAREMLMKKLESKEALEKFKEFVKVQGGEVDYIDNPELFKKSKIKKEVTLNKKGYISKINGLCIGEALLALGGARITKDTAIKHEVGIYLVKKVAQKIEKNTVVAYIYANSEKELEEAIVLLEKAYTVTKEEPKATNIIRAIIKS